MSRFGKKCKFCAKVKVHVGKYGQCRPHALLQSYHDNPCVDCAFEGNCGSDINECTAGYNRIFTGSRFTQDGKYYGDETEWIIKTPYGYKYHAHNGNSAIVVFGRIIRYKYFGNCRSELLDETNQSLS